MQAAKSLLAWLATVLTALLCAKQQHIRPAVRSQQVDLPDVESSNLLTHLPGCIDFITKALAGGGKVLVHCAAGVSRSTTVRDSGMLYNFMLVWTPAPAASSGALRDCRA